MVHGHKRNLLINGDLKGDLRPQTSIFDRCDLLLGVPVHMHVKHQSTERCPKVKGQVLIRHTAQDQIHIQLARDFVDSQVLAVQTHPGKEVQLTPAKVQGHFSRINLVQQLILKYVSPSSSPVVTDHLHVLLLTFFSILGQLPDALTPDLLTVVLPEKPDLLFVLGLHGTFSI